MHSAADVAVNDHHVVHRAIQTLPLLMTLSRKYVADVFKPLYPRGFVRMQSVGK